MKRWIKVTWIIGLVGAVIWALFSTLQIAVEAYQILIFDPALIINTFICVPQCNLMWPQEPFSDILYYCLSDVIIFIARIIANLLFIGGITFGLIKKNSVCAIIILMLPFLNFLLATRIGQLSSYGTSGADGFLIVFIFMGDLVISILLLIGIVGVFSYRRAIRGNYENYTKDETEN